MTDSLKERLADAEAENFRLAAGQCIYPNGEGLLGDEHGNSFCSVERERKRLEVREAEHFARITQLEAEVERLTRERDYLAMMEKAANETAMAAADKLAALHPQGDRQP